MIGYSNAFRFIKSDFERYMTLHQNGGGMFCQSINADVVFGKRIQVYFLVAASWRKKYF